MPRKARIAPPGYFYHVMNHAAGRLVMLKKEADFALVQQVLVEAHEQHPLPILAWCFMPDHWHFIVRANKAGQMTGFVRWFTQTHAVRWRSSHPNAGLGQVYCGRFKAFPIQPGDHLLETMRYVERNAVSAGRAARAQDWPWSSFIARQKGPQELRDVLTAPQGGLPDGWTKYVNHAIEPKELARLETSEQRSRPYGDEAWVAKVVAKLGLEHTVRSIGRPRKAPAE